jgi:pilus assembly protein CpaC
MVMLLAALAPAWLTAQAPVERVQLTTGRSTVTFTDFDVIRIAVTNPAVADAIVVSPREVLVDGKAPGTTSLIIWGDGTRVQYDVVVLAPVPPLQEQMQQLFPGENIGVSIVNEAIILSGSVSSNNVMLRAAEVATATSAGSRIINMLQVPGGIESQQVLLQVRIAEVSRIALSELGVSFFTGLAGNNDLVGRLSTQQFTAPNFQSFTRSDDGVTTGPSELTFSDFLNIFLFNTQYDAGVVIRALRTRGLFQSLAEPNLIAYNGQEASFLAGGEIPVPVVQGTTGTVSITYREFGVRLAFMPTIAGDVIRLRVRPEVSALDFSNGISMQGFRIPALSTRRAETEVELRDGQSFAIAGLMGNVSQEDGARIPLLGDVPIIGALFRSRATRTEQTELMVLVTPRLVRPLNPDEVPPLPINPERFLDAPPGP